LLDGNFQVKSLFGEVYKQYFLSINEFFLCISARLCLCLLIGGMVLVCFIFLRLFVLPFFLSIQLQKVQLKMVVTPTDGIDGIFDWKLGEKKASRSNTKI